ncbi:type VI secretion system lipoprotein TssJ [Chitinibacter sp. GC72]|uniref:type VI secretion system lipoprotein TssJ n=1 Tax=Chitinibacter sp. GC72 TaxID=1526917 RepID=UPI0012FA8855|nr:type VI secretion system lipoprotein TssJ [Chitinibacter sp. GC72]
MRSFVVITIACLLLSACASRPQNMDVLVVADSAVNPDSNGRPSPVIMKLYQMKGDRAFKSADYFQLGQSTEPFSPEILSIEELILQPSDVTRFTRPISTEAKYLATFVAFRDVDSSRWRNAGEVGDVRTFEIPFVNWGYRQNLALLVEVAPAKVKLSSPPSTAVLTAVEAASKAGRLASVLPASLGSRASAAVEKAASQAAAQGEQMVKEKTKDALLKKLPSLR